MIFFVIITNLNEPKAENMFKTYWWLLADDIWVNEQTHMIITRIVYYFLHYLNTNWYTSTGLTSETYLTRIFKDITLFLLQLSRILHWHGKRAYGLCQASAFFG